MTFQIIRENNIPQFAVLPFSGLEALENYADEIWAEQSVEEYLHRPKGETLSLPEAKQFLTAKADNTVTFPCRGMTLMEVLASVFVICIGLMGVLAVIPFGAFQVSKAREAEFTSNMLANAKNEIQVGEWTKFKKWTEAKTANATANINPLDETNNNVQYSDFLSAGPTHRVRFDRFYLVDPFDNQGKAADTGHIFPVGKNFDHRSLIQEAFRGQDDLQFSIYKDKRTDFAGQGYKVLSSGKYSWFFMFKPVYDTANPFTGNYQTLVPVENLTQTTAVDLLGCYNRTPGDEGIAYARYNSSPAATASDVERFLTGAQVILRAETPEALDLTKTKWLFISWRVYDDGGNATTAPAAAYDGQWCKVVNFTPVVQESIQVIDSDNLNNVTVNTQFSSKVFLASFPSPTTNSGNMNVLHVLNVPGVLYHTTVNVPLN